MQVVILAGGLGTRLRSVAPDTPKAIVPVAGLPFMDHQLALLRANGLTSVLLCIGHFGGWLLWHQRGLLGAAESVATHAKTRPEDSESLPSLRMPFAPAFLVSLILIKIAYLQGWGI